MLLLLGNNRNGRLRRHPLCGCTMQRRSTGSRAWNGKQHSSREHPREDGRERTMKTRSTQEKHTAGVATAQRDLAPRLSFSNVQEREAHIRAFFAWLPQILREAPGIQWERLPSQVMGYLIRTVADNPDAIPLTLAIGSAMDAMKPKSLYASCQSITNLLKRLRSHYGMTTLAELAERSIWDQ